ncbi:MAG: class I SAM-dependent methyltransferase [Gammaproteobacteria bacterium]|nr:class I SAM-dependent methyltransferase [Gammaproteobacteria bacterium]
MGDFSADWLALREPADRRARDGHLVDLLRSYGARLSTGTAEDAGVGGVNRKPPAFITGPGGVEAATSVSPDADQSRRWPDDRALAGQLDPTRAVPCSPWRILDLGCGTGSNLRYLAPRLGAAPVAMAWRQQEWWCLDRDPRLLAELERRIPPTATRASDLDLVVKTLRQDLARGVGSLLPLPLDARTLVTASALLDLVSADWLAGLLWACAASASPLLLVLTYDGRVELSPAHPLDGTLVDLFNAHQRRDKGLGPALGPTAPERLALLADEWGFAREVSPSDWVLGPGDAELVTALIEGWAAAAWEQAEGEPEAARLAVAIGSWREARLAQNASGWLRLRVGHQDALLLPALRSDR